MDSMLALLDDAVGFENMSPPDALLQCGWEQAEPNCFRLQTATGPAELHLWDQSAAWQRFRLVSPALDAATPEQILTPLQIFAANADLRIAAKFVTAGENGAACCLEIPEEWLGETASHYHAGLDPVLFNPALAWARGLTVFLVGGGQAECQHASPPDLVAALQEMNWSASLDEDQIHVHIQLAGIYRQAAVDLEPTGFRVRADLVETAELPERARRAIWRLAAQANRRLPLVRYACASAGAALRAEVFVNVALIPGGWLFAALHAVETAVAMTALELEALRDPEFAEWFLAAQGRSSPRPIE